MEDPPPAKKFLVEGPEGIPIMKDVDTEPVSVSGSYQFSRLESLPTEVLHLIVSYLSFCDKKALQTVCRRLHIILNDPDTWKSLIIPHYINSKSPKYVKSILKQTKCHVKCLSLVGYIPTVKSDISFLTSCISITTLDLYGSQISNSAIKQLICTLTNVSRLSISNDVICDLLSNGMLLSSKIQQLVVHNMSMVLFSSLKKSEKMRPSNLAIICDGELIPSCMSMARQLSEAIPINLSVYINPSDIALDAVSMPVVSYSHDTLNIGFRIPGADIDNSAIIVSSAVSSSVLSVNMNYTCAHLQNLHASPVKAIRHFDAKTAASITCLDLEGRTLQSLEDVWAILELTPNLLVISINGIEFPKRAEPADPLDILFRPLSMYCHRLTSIYSIVADNICDVQDISEVWKCISYLQHLKHLSICSCLFEGPSPSKYHQFSPDLTFLPLFFKSLIVNIHQTESIKVVSFYHIFSVIEKIRTLQLLHVYIDYPRDQRQLNVQVLLERCTDIVELGIFNVQRGTGHYGRKLIHSPSAIGRLKSLMLEKVSLLDSFCTDLVPLGQDNTNLQMLHLDVQKMHTEEMTRIMEHCPRLVSFTVNFLSAALPGGFAHHCKAAKKTAKKLKLLNFVCRGYTLVNRSIPNYFYFSMFKNM